MEDLTKTQIVLLCLLVSFVTSIGTGIITTSLLREVPQNVTQTINRVVERTVETVVPETTNTNTVTREVTVVVKEEDLIISSIQRSRNSMVRIMKDSGGRGTDAAVAEFQTIGVVVKSDGTILADKRYINDSDSYSAVFASDNQSVPLKIAKRSETTNAIFLTPVLRNGATRTFVATRIAGSSSEASAAENPQLGQTVIAVGGQEKEAVAIGRINSLNTESASSTVATIIETDTPLRDSIPGSVLLNLNGELIGYEAFERAGTGEALYTAIGAFRRANPDFF